MDPPPRAWRSELARLALVLAPAGAAGWLAGAPLAAPLAAMVLWSGYILHRLRRLERDAADRRRTLFDKAEKSSTDLEIGIVMVDEDGNLEWCNRTGEDLLGLRRSEDRGRSVTSLVRDPLFVEYFDGGRYAEPLKFSAPGSVNRVLECRIALYGERGRLMVVRDITRLHRLEQMRTDFVGNVSHELGTPITVIKGYLEAIMANMEDLDEKWRRPARQMHQQSLRMKNLVNDLLLLSSLETQSLSGRQGRIELSVLISEIQHETQHVFDSKGHALSIHCRRDIRLIGDRKEIYSALSNLVNNAAKYTPRDGTIAIKAYFSGPFFDIEVIDNGIGIESRHIPRLTERFYRIDAGRSSETGSTGLGLAIVKHVLARHGAELEIDSDLGRGSRFVCRFPVDRIEVDAEGVDGPSERDR